MSKALVVRVEETPRLRSAAIPALKTGETGFLGHVQLDHSDIVVEATRIGDRLLLNGPGVTQMIDLVRVQQTFGWATYFARPDGPGRCTTLFLVDGKFLSSATCKSVYASQSLSPIARKKQTAARLGERLEKSPIRGKAPSARTAARLTKFAELSDFHDDRSKVELERRRERALRDEDGKRSRSRKTPNLGRRLDQGHYELEMSLQHLVPESAVPAQGLARSTSRQAPKRGAPELHVRKLVIGHLGAPRWYQWGEGDNALLVLVARDPDFSKRPVLRLDICVSGSPPRFLTRQEIALGGGRRRGDAFFLCPVTGKRALTLFFREGRFASGFAQKLRSVPRGEFAELGLGLVPLRGVQAPAKRAPITLERGGTSPSL